MQGGTVKTKVIIPWREDESRKPGFEWLLKYYEHRLGAGSVYVSPSPTGPFNRSAAINAGIRQFPGHRIVISDADCFICNHGLNRALVEVDDSEMVIPHNQFVPCNRTQKQWLLAKDPREPVRANWWKNRRQRRCAQSGIWVVTYDFFMSSPMDERFAGWGCEDTEFLRRRPSRRFNGPLYHILHKRPSKKHFRRNKKLAREIRAGK